MTDFGTYFFVSILALAIGLAVQYYLIKAAVLSALKENANATQTDQNVKWLLEIIAKGAGDKEAAAAYFKEKRIQEYNKKAQELKATYYYPEGEEKAEKIRLLKEEYADLFEEEKE